MKSLKTLEHRTEPKFFSADGLSNGYKDKMKFKEPSANKDEDFFRKIIHQTDKLQRKWGLPPLCSNFLMPTIVPLELSCIYENVIDLFENSSFVNESCLSNTSNHS